MTWFPVVAVGVYVTWHVLVVVELPTWARLQVPPDPKAPAAPIVEDVSRLKPTVPVGKLLLPLSASDTVAVHVAASLMARGVSQETLVVVPRNRTLKSVALSALAPKL